MREWKGKTTKFRGGSEWGIECLDFSLFRALSMIEGLYLWEKGRGFI